MRPGPAQHVPPEEVDEEAGQLERHVREADLRACKMIVCMYGRVAVTIWLYEVKYGCIVIVVLPTLVRILTVRTGHTAIFHTKNCQTNNR